MTQSSHQSSVIVVSACLVSSVAVLKLLFSGGSFKVILSF